MLRTALCDVLGIDVPIILAAMGGTASSAEFAAAASNEGALGSIASLFRTNAASLRYRQASSGSVPGRMLPKLAMNLCPAD